MILISYDKILKNFPKECYDKIFTIENLDALLNELKLQEEKQLNKDRIQYEKLKLQFEGK